tara:strand:+ start:176 stop:409 length:234 start_codon:yes stop_codon:yes gene_type:complete
MRLKQLVQKHRNLMSDVSFWQEKVFERVRQWADDGKSLSQIQEETGYSFRHIGFILGRKKYEAMVFDERESNGTKVS